MASEKDLRDIFDLDSVFEKGDVTREAIFGESKKKKVKGASIKRPEGVSREVWRLRCTDNELAIDATPSCESDTNRGYKKVKAMIGRSKVEPWLMTECTNPARNDGLIFRKWMKESKINDENPFAKFNVKVDVPAYSDREYQHYLHCENWTKQETDYLFELCRRFDLRFVIIQDRWDSNFAQRRSIEDLKERYYGICKILTKLRDPDYKRKAKKDFNADYERIRKKNLEKLYHKMKEQTEEDEDGTREAQGIKELEISQYLKKIIACKKAEGKMSKKMSQAKTHDSFLLSDTRSLKFPELKQSGVILRSQKMKLPLSLGQKKTKAIEQSLEELEIDIHPLPTQEIVSEFNELRQNIVLLYELKIALSNCETEIQSLRNRVEALAPKKINEIDADGTE